MASFAIREAGHFCQRLYTRYFRSGRLPSHKVATLAVVSTRFPETGLSKRLSRDQHVGLVTCHL
jgi:hypothetical protein